MNSVFIVVTILNGYKNIANVFTSKQDAENHAEHLRNSWAYGKHEIYVCEYGVF